MLRRIISAVVVLGLCVGLALAEEIRAVITKVEGNKVTFAPMKGKGQRGEEQTLPAARNVKVVKGKYNRKDKTFEKTGDIDEGLKAKMFSDIGEKGIGAIIVTNDDNTKITEIKLMKGRGKKKKDQ
jgi:hypothetical protein